MDTPCTFADNVKCTHCGEISVVAHLETREGQAFPRPDKNGASWRSTYYYCRNCDDKYAKVFDPGDDSGLVLGANVELVSEKQPA